jgi:glycerate kinase
LQYFHGSHSHGLGSVHLELLMTVRDAHLQACFDRAQVRVHRTAQVGQAGIVVRGEGVSDDQVDNPVRGGFAGLFAGRGAPILLHINAT